MSQECVIEADVPDELLDDPADHPADDPADDPAGDPPDDPEVDAVSRSAAARNTAMASDWPVNSSQIDI